MRLTRVAGLFAWTIAAVLFAAVGAAQVLDVERPVVLTVGTPNDGACTARIDEARTGSVRTPLPRAGLHTAWRTSVGALVEFGPLVDTRGRSYLVGTRGEVIVLSPDGGEVWRVVTNTGQSGPATLLSDSTIVFMDEAGEAVAVHEGHLRWRTRVGRAGASAPAPLPLSDGGVVVATAHELSALDADGHERARTVLNEASAVELISGMGEVLVVASSGSVFGWVPGRPGLKRFGTFESSIDGSAARADEHTLLAVTHGRARLSALDLARGTTTTRASIPEGLWFGPPAMAGTTAYAVLSSPSADFVVAVDERAAEVGRAVVQAHARPMGQDGGANSPAPSPLTPPLVDAAGTFVFASSGGTLGVVTALAAGRPTVDLLADVCSIPAAPLGSNGRSESPVGMAPLAPSGLVVACRAGTIVAVR